MRRPPFHWFLATLLIISPLRSLADEKSSDGGVEPGSVPVAADFQSETDTPVRHQGTAVDADSPGATAVADSTKASPGAKSPARSAGQVGKPKASRAGNDFDRELVKHFSDDFVLYMAIRDVNAEGPLMDRAMSDEETPGLGVQAQQIKKVFHDLKQVAIAQGVIEKDIRELFVDGLAIGIRPPPEGEGDPAVLIVVPTNPKIEKFHDLILDKYKSPEAAKGLIKVDVGDGLTAHILKDAAPKNPPVLLKTSDFIYLSSDANVISQCLKSRKSRKGGFASTRAYGKGREAVKSDAIGFVILPPKSFLTAIARAEVNPQRKMKYADAIEAAQAVDVFVIQIMANPAQSEILGSVVFNSKHPKFDNVLGFLPGRGLAGPKSAPQSTDLFLGFLRPQNVAQFVAAGAQPQVDAQMKQLKGIVQMQAGLRYEKDIEPWWGQEISLLAVTGLEGQPEVAVLLESKDDVTAAGAMKKIVNHLTYTRNQTFSPTTLGGVEVQVAQPSPDRPGLTPAICQIPGFLILATGTGVINEILTSKQSIQGTRGFQQVMMSVDEGRMAFALELKTALLAKLPQYQQAEGSAQQQGLEALRTLTEKIEAILVAVGMKGEDSMNFSLMFVGR